MRIPIRRFAVGINVNFLVWGKGIVMIVILIKTLNILLKNADDDVQT